MHSCPPSAVRDLQMADADVALYEALFPAKAADTYLESLTAGIAWHTRQIKLYGRVLDMPRLTAWYGDPGRTYTYSGVTEAPREWTPDLLAIRAQVEAATGHTFNSVLLNLYRGGRDSMSWHSDDEPELGPDPVIASVSFGAARRFQFRHKRLPGLRASVNLTHGSLLLMRGATQRFWKHQLPKSARPLGPRINLTFRTILG